MLRYWDFFIDKIIVYGKKIVFWSLSLLRFVGMF